MFNIILLIVCVIICVEGRDYEYNGGKIITSPEIAIILYGSPEKYEYHDYIVNKEMEDYIKLFSQQLGWLSEYGNLKLPTYAGTYVIDVNVDITNVIFSSQELSNMINNGNISNTENTVYVVFFPKGNTNMITSNGGFCSTNGTCNPFSIITDPSANISTIPGKRDLFLISVALGSMTLLGLICWPLIACSKSFKCWKNGIKCGINITGRTVMHVSMMTIVTLMSITGIFYILIGLQDYRDEIYWTGIGLVIASGGVILTWCIIYMITIALKSTTKEEWFFSYKIEDVRVFNTVYGISILTSLLVTGIMLWQSMMSAVYLSVSHETIEMLTNQWTWEGKQICDVCLLEWKEVGDKYMEKCWSNVYQACY